MGDMEKRRAERIEENFPAKVTVEGKEYNCEIHNYSETGAYIKFLEDLPAALRLSIIGQEALIKVPEEYKDKVSGSAKCIRLVNQDGEEYLAVHFPAFKNILQEIND